MGARSRTRAKSPRWSHERLQPRWRRGLLGAQTRSGVERSCAFACAPLRLLWARLPLVDEVADTLLAAMSGHLPGGPTPPGMAEWEPLVVDVEHQVGFLSGALDGLERRSWLITAATPAS